MRTSLKRTHIRAILFDFDGLILDTETALVDVWKTIYTDYGCDFPLDLWSQNIGFWGNAKFDPATHLHELTEGLAGCGVPSTAATTRRAHGSSSVDRSGRACRTIWRRARRLGLRLAVASSSPRRYVESHLTRLGLVHHFERIITADDVPPGRGKPHPDIYLKALEALGVNASEAVALEDSPAGVAAAHAAGIYVVAVTNPTTTQLEHEDANLRLSSLADLPLQTLLMNFVQ